MENTEGVDLFFFLKGLAMGVILTATVPPATIWLVQVGFRQGWGRALAAAGGVAAGQCLLGTGMGYCLWLVLPFWQYLGWPLRWVALGIVAWMAWRQFWAGGPTELRAPEEAIFPAGSRQMFFQSFYLLVTIPMRVPATFAYIIGLAVLWRMDGPERLVELGAGVFLGALGWGAFFVLLGSVTAGRVEDAIIQHSLHKLNRFAALVWALLFVLTLVPILALG